MGTVTQYAKHIQIQGPRIIVNSLAAVFIHANCILGYSVQNVLQLKKKSKKQNQKRLPTLETLQILCSLKFTGGKKRNQEGFSCSVLYFTKEWTSQQMCSIVLSTYQQSPGSSEVLLFSMLYWVLEGEKVNWV